MPCYKITFTHSAMRPDYVGKAIKYANTPDDAAKLLGKYDKKLNMIIDKRNSVLSNIKINEIQD